MCTLACGKIVSTARSKYLRVRHKTGSVGGGESHRRVTERLEAKDKKVSRPERARDARAVRVLPAMTKAGMSA